MTLSVTVSLSDFPAAPTQLNEYSIYLSVEAESREEIGAEVCDYTVTGGEC